MAFSPNWIDPNNPEGASGAWQHQLMMDAGSGTYYALLDDQAGSFALYVSTDDTATWSLLNSACPISASGNYLLQTQLIGGVIRVVMTLVVSTGSSSIVNFFEYTIGTDTWSAVTNIGGSFEQTAFSSLAATMAPGLMQFKRLDGSRIIIYQCELSSPYPNGFWQIRILKETGGVWTQIKLFSNPGIFQHFISFSAGINPVTDRIYGFLNTAVATDPSHPNEYISSDMYGFVVNTNDAVTSGLIETLQEFMPATLNPNQAQDSTENGRVAFSTDGLTVAFGYGYFTNTHPNGDDASVAVKVAIGDLSATPLSPSWSVEQVASLTPKNWNIGFSNDINVSFEDSPVIYLEAFGTIGITSSVWCGAAHHTGAGTGLKCYWGSRVTAASNNTSKLFWSLRTAPNTWSAKAILFPDPDRDTIHLDGFDVPPPFVAAATPAITLDASVGASFTFGTTGGGTISSASHALCAINTATAGALADTPYIVRRYSFSHEPMPPDTVFMTQWSDLGYQFQKVARNLLLDIDTAGVAASVALQSDGTTKQTFSVTTTSHDRDRVLSCNSDLEGKFWRLTLAPGANAKTQLFKAGLDYVPDTNIVTYLDTYEQDFGYVSWKYIKRGWVEYKGGPITLDFLVDNNLLFYSVTLPAHAVRDMTQFYLPASNAGVLNKSKTYRIQITGSNGFRLYADSELEWYAFGSDELGSFSMAQFSPEMKLPIAQAAVGMWGL